MKKQPAGPRTATLPELAHGTSELPDIPSGFFSSPRLQCKRGLSKEVLSRNFQKVFLIHVLSNGSALGMQLNFPARCHDIVLRVHQNNPTLCVPSAAFRQESNAHIFFFLWSYKLNTKCGSLKVSPELRQYKLFNSFFASNERKCFDSIGVRERPREYPASASCHTINKPKQPRCVATVGGTRGESSCVFLL